VRLQGTTCAAGEWPNERLLLHKKAFHTASEFLLWRYGQQLSDIGYRISAIRTARSRFTKRCS
jgi:hypothetical protein